MAKRYSHERGEVKRSFATGVLVFAAALYFVVRPQSGTAEFVKGPVVDVKSVVPDAAFVDQRSRPFALSSLRGRRYAMSFMYTRCPEMRMCPLVSAKYRQVQSDRRASYADLVEVTLDPEFDTPRVLERYGRTFGADARRWHLLTGPPRAVHDFASRFGVQARRDDNRVLHTERTVIVDADGRIERFVDDPAWTARDLVLLLDRQESAWSRLARASGHTFAWCGEAIGATGRTAVHHVAVILSPIAFLAGLVGLARLADSRRSNRAERRS